MGEARGTTAAVAGSALALLGLALLAFLPIMLVLMLDLWIPVLAIHETFGVHYVPYALLKHGYAFVRNAHLFALAYAFVPSALVHDVFTTWPDVAKFQMFGLWIYATQGLILTLLSLVVVRSALPPAEKALVLAVAFAQPILTTRVLNALTINYHMLEAPLYAVLAYLSIRWLAGEEGHGARRAAALGALAGLAAGTKLTLLVGMVPFLVVVALPQTGGRRVTVRAAVSFSAGLLAVVGAGFISYFHFRPGDLGRLARDLVRLNLDTRWLHQRVDPLVEALTHWLQPSSITFGFQVVVTLWAGLVGGLVVALARRPERRLTTFLGLSLATSAFLGYVLWRRTAPNTLLEATLFCLFQIAVMASIYRRRWTVGAAPVAALALIVAAMVVELWMYRPLEVIGSVRAVSQLSRAIHGMLEAEPRLPIVYYLPHTSASLIFPSVHLYPLVSGDRAPLERVYLARYHPRVRVQAPGDGVVAAPHMMVVPEYRPVDGTTPAVRVFDVMPPFEAIREAPENTCRGFDFGPGRQALDLQFREQPTTVTVCTVRKIPAAEMASPGNRSGPTGRNVALGRPARQSSTWEGATASLAVDGRTRSEESITHTAWEWHPWWEVDLGTVVRVEEIRIWNRPDCCRERLRNLHVFVSTRPFASTDIATTRSDQTVRAFFVGSPVGRPTTISVGAAGRHVRIQLAEGNYLTLAETEVWGRGR